MKLSKLHDLKRLNYIELFPGSLFKGYLNEESIYIDDDSFSFVVAAIKKSFEQYKPFECLEIEKGQWLSIIQELLNLREIIISKDWIKLEEYISLFYIEESVCKWKLAEYLKINILELEALINELIGWIEAQLIVNERITLIGL
ncbi:hypothetical protein H1230_06975 [Paenibacillus sp. 19GGS1-52]|uniref:hypothetical protein n=1 Tax=Paenibacillus sp. 19GGS1-52 TaxID=2758563 RepID=UPI001EFB169E|nr:hypothetical protein [Paenibacillus sp. 19GGS1-52]ULO08542.1 hypothetical protein H1230_06975 [Paenibacillus sp. 19GGS1-52]